MYERSDWLDDESDRGGDRQAQIEHEREVPDVDDYAYDEDVAYEGTEYPEFDS